LTDEKHGKGELPTNVRAEKSSLETDPRKKLCLGRGRKKKREQQSGRRGKWEKEKRVPKRLRGTQKQKRKSREMSTPPTGHIRKE